MVIGVDIDGTLTIEKEGHDYARRTPNKKMIDRVNKWYEEGHIIMLFTARWESDRKITKQWLKDHRVFHHALILGKPSFDLYVDDIAKRPEEVCK